MFRSLVLIILFFCVLILVQTSFLVYFNIVGIVPNLILISVIFINFFQKPENQTGLWSGVFGGFFLDIFSSRPIGFWILILLATTILIKIILKKYVRLQLVSRI